MEAARRAWLRTVGQPCPNVKERGGEISWDEPKAEVVRRVYSLYAEGNGAKKIITVLRDESAPAPGPLGWSKSTVRALLNRPIYVGTLEFRCSTGDAKVRKQENQITVPAPHLRIVPEDLERRVRAQQAKNRASILRGEATLKKDSKDGRPKGTVIQGVLLAKPESAAASKFLCNVITKCHVCGGSLIYWNRGKRTKPMYYCSTKIHRGTCENGAGIPVEALDYAVKVKLLDLLDKDFDRVLDLCPEQAKVWREKAAMPKDQRAQLGREQKRLGPAEAVRGRVGRDQGQTRPGGRAGTVARGPSRQPATLWPPGRTRRRRRVGDAADSP